MYTIEEVAAAIEQLKPDFNEFLTALQYGPESKLHSDIANTSDIFSKCLKIEIVIMFQTIHNRSRLWDIRKFFTSIYVDTISNNGVLQRYYNRYDEYYIDTEFRKDCHILAHISNPRPYLPKYLWDKVKLKKQLQVAPIKQLQPDEMSLKIFESYLKTLKKPLTSIEARNYLKQLKSASFASIQEKFINLIFEYCHKPSLELQKDLSLHQHSSGIPVLPNQTSTVVHKHMTLSRSAVKSLAYSLQIPIAYSMHDSLDSTYREKCFPLGCLISYEEFMDWFEFDTVLTLPNIQPYAENLNAIIGSNPIHFRIVFNKLLTSFDNYSRIYQRRQRY